MAGSMIGRLLRPARAGQRHSVWTRPGLQASDTLRVTSGAFAHGAPIPRAHAGESVGDNLSPPLSWAGVPPQTAQLLLVLEDTDVPLPWPQVHTVALIQPTSTGLGRGDLRPGVTGVQLVPVAFGRRGYAGPRPLPGHGPHHYGFHLFALDRVLSDTDRQGLKHVLAAAEGHVIARGRLIGTYER